MASLSLCSTPGFKHIATLFLLLGICIGRVILHAVLCVPPVRWLFLQPLLPGIRVLLRQAFVLLVHFCCLLWDVGLVVGGGFFPSCSVCFIDHGGCRSKGSVQRFLLFGQMCQWAFDNLKALLGTAPVLFAPDFSRPFKLALDTSDAGVGAVLLQLPSVETSCLLFFFQVQSASETVFHHWEGGFGPYPCSGAP